MIRKLFLLAVPLLMIACGGREESTMNPYETADVQAAAYDFQIFPKAEFLPTLTELFRKAHFVLHPGATTAPPMAAYQTDASVKEVAEFYAAKYGYPKVADNAANNFSSVPPQAYYRTGDINADATGAQEIYGKLGLKPDLTKATGTYEGAHINQTANYPRVTIQRPYFDPSTNAVVQKTLIILVKE